MDWVRPCATSGVCGEKLTDSLRLPLCNTDISGSQHHRNDNRCNKDVSRSYGHGLHRNVRNFLSLRLRG
jgi:hypothetical protein